MSKERLEEIKGSVSKQVYDRLILPKTKVTIDYRDYKYLHEQAERVEELEKKNYGLQEDLAGRHSTIEELNEKIDEIFQQNKRYREAIEKALDEGVTIEDCSKAIDRIYGILGEALEESK